MRLVTIVPRQFSDRDSNEKISRMAYFDLPLVKL